MMTELACLFTIYHYGESGTELPPPIQNTQHHVVSNEQYGFSEKDFRSQMQSLGMMLRTSLIAQFNKKPNNYSKASGCDWLIVSMHSISTLIDEVLK